MGGKLTGGERRQVNKQSGVDRKHIDGRWWDIGEGMDSESIRDEKIEYEALEGE